MGNHSTRTGSQGAWQRFERGEADLSIPFLSVVWLRPVQYRAGKGLVCRILQEAGVACVSFRYQAVHPSVSRIRNLPYSASRFLATERLKVDGCEVDSLVSTYIIGSQALYQN